MSRESKKKVRMMVRSLYDLQELRIQTGNRLVANFRSKLGLDNDNDSDEDMIKDIVSKSYERITDGIQEISKRYKFDYDGVISDYAELVLADSYEGIKEKEENGFKKLKHLLEGIPIWEEFLKDVDGVGEAMAGVIISEMDPKKAPYPSSFWKYSGLDVVNGKGRSREEEHLREYEYEDSNGNTKTKKGLTFNPFLKTKLVGVLGPSFLKCGDKYKEIYYNYRNRIENMDKHSDKSDGHIHNMSIRYAVKMFLKDLHLKWRELEGLKVPKPYHEAKLNHKHRN